MFYPPALRPASREVVWGCNLETNQILRINRLRFQFLWHYHLNLSLKKAFHYPQPPWRLKHRTNLEAVLQPLMHLNYQIVIYSGNTKSKKKASEILSTHCARKSDSRQNVICPWLIMLTSLPHLPPTPSVPPTLPIFKNIAPPCSRCSYGPAYSLKGCPRNSFWFKYTNNISSFILAWVAQLVEQSGHVLRTVVRFPSLAIFFL